MCRSGNQQLYFCNPASGETRKILRQVFRTLKARRSFEPARIDELREAVLVGRRVTIEPAELPVITAALCLSGIEVESLEL